MLLDVLIRSFDSFRTRVVDYEPLHNPKRYLLMRDGVLIQSCVCGVCAVCHRVYSLVLCPSVCLYNANV